MANIRKEDVLAVENAGLRELLTQAGIDAARLLAQAGIDATATESARKLQQLLLEELHHRVKNTLAIVMAITSQSLRTAETLEQGRLAVESRLIALGKAHDLLLRSKWTGARLTDLIYTAIEPFDADDVHRFAVRETEIEVGPAAVLPLMLALNELCTNAVKYGALSDSAGHVEIASGFDAKAQRLSLTWTERGGPPILQPRQPSFGTRLINRLAGELHGEVRLNYDPAGLVCEFSVPVVRPA